MPVTKYFIEGDTQGRNFMVAHIKIITDNFRIHNICV